MARSIKKSSGIPEDAVFHPAAMLSIREERDATAPMGRSSGFRFILLAALPIKH
jgi:hypothetical protein